MKRKLGLLMLIGLLLLSVAPVWAEDGFYVIAGGGAVGTKITSLPYTINEPGFYYLGKNLTTTGDGIYVNASDVTIDLMGFKLQGPGTFSTARGISFGNDVRNVEIRNGTLRSWHYAIGKDGDNSLHNDLRIINVRILFPFYGISLNNSYNLLIKGCTISDMVIGIAIAGGSGTICNNSLNYASTSSPIIGACIWFGGGLWTVRNNILSNAQDVLIFQGAGIIIGNTINCLAGQTGLSLTSATDNTILVSQNTVTGAGTHRSGGHAYIFYVGNVGLTNTNSFLAPSP